MASRSPVAAANRPEPYLSYEDFLKEYDGESAEWVDGRVERMSPITVSHDGLTGWLYAIMREYVTYQGLGIVLHDKFQMKPGPGFAGREPDVVYLSETNRSRLRRAHIDGPADLAVEIISDDSVERDRVTKYDEYERSGVREYWILDPETRQADFYVLGPDGRYAPASPDTDGVYRSAALPGFWTHTEWLWAAVPPSVVSVMREWGLL
jgi:Uma2 family endonuclease